MNKRGARTNTVKGQMERNMDSTTPLQELEETYYAAANALTRYKREHGFKPGARVVARFRDEPEKRGVIAPYGDAWSTVMHMSVPVLLDNGRLQPWNMSDLTVQKQ